MNILLDAMGGDKAPDANIKGAVKAINQIKAEVILIGKEEIIRKKVKEFYGKEIEEISSRLKVKNASETIEMEDQPTVAIKHKKDYASDADCGIVISMDCSLDMTNIYYSAWLEGYWAGLGSDRTKGAGNDEINLKQMMNISNVKISHYSTTDIHSKKLYDKYFGKVK